MGISMLFMELNNEGVVLKLGSVPTMEQGMGLGIRWYILPKKGNLYLVKVDCSGGKCRQKWIGNVEVIEKIMDEKKRRGPRPYRSAPHPIVAGPGGFEPPTTGLGETHSMTARGSRENGNSNETMPGMDTAGIGTLPFPPREQWLQWLHVEEQTKRAYASYYDKLQAKYPSGIPLEAIPELSRAKWYRYTIRKIAQYAWLQGIIPLELRARVEELAKAPSAREIPHAPEVSVEDMKKTIEALGDNRYRLMYLVMYYSGARLTEAEHLFQIARELRPVTQDQAPEYKGYIILGRSVRVALHFNRGKKRCEFLWLPAWLFDLLRSYQGEPPRARALTSYIRNKKSRDDLHLLDPKLVRKLHYQIMEQLEIDKDVREIIQNRIGRATVGDIAYSRILRRADEAYEHRVLPHLEERLRMGEG